MRIRSHICSFIVTGTLLSLGVPGILAQSEAEVVEEVSVVNEGALQANPRDDQYRIASMIYDQAMAEKQNKEERRRLLELAVVRLRDYVKTYPNEAYAQDALYKSALCLYELGMEPEARAALTGLVSRYKTGSYVSAAAYRLASADYAAKNYQSALTYYSVAAEQSDKDELKLSARYMLAHCYLMLNRKQDAVAIFTAVASDPKAMPNLKYSSMISLASLDVEGNNLEKALALYGQVAAAKDVDKKTKGTALMQGASTAISAKKPDVAAKFYSTILHSPELREFIPQAQLGLMELLYQEKKYEEVVAQMKKNAAPMADKAQDARRYLLAGQASLFLKKYNDAIAYFSSVESLLPLSEMAFESAYRRLLCSQELKLPNVNETMKVFLDTYGKRFPDSPYIHMVRVMQADDLYATDPQKAAQLFHSVDVSRLPVSMRADVLFKRAWVQASINDRANARSSLDDFITQYPTDKRMPEALVLRGEMYMNMNDDAGAMADFNRVIKSYPRNEVAAVAWQRAAQMYSRKLDTKNMIKHYEGLINNFPKAKPAAIAEANYMIGKGYFDEKKYAQAVIYLEEARTLLPNRYRDSANNYLVYSFYELRDVQKLRTVYDRLRKENYQAAEAIPDAIPAWLGAQCYSHKDYTGADLYLSAAADINEPQRTKSVIWATLAKSRMRIGKFERALTAIEHYLEAEKAPARRAQGLLDKAVILARLDKPEDARKIAEEALSIGVEGPLKASLNIVLGDIYYAQENYEEAARLYGLTAALFTSDRELKPQALYKAAVALEKQGKREEAAKFASDLNQEYPNWKPSEDIFKPMN